MTLKPWARSSSSVYAFLSVAFCERKRPMNPVLVTVKAGWDISFLARARDLEGPSVAMDATSFDPCESIRTSSWTARMQRSMRHATVFRRRRELAEAAVRAFSLSFRRQALLRALLFSVCFKLLWLRFDSELEDVVGGLDNGGLTGGGLVQDTDTPALLAGMGPDSEVRTGIMRAGDSIDFCAPPGRDPSWEKSPSGSSQSSSTTTPRSSLRSAR